ncbi:MAG: hypothetical protein SWZ49_07860 [Cyanobacteriota bacterium]|nr:hypothetical protein [Cyanobacteriota bacterium]
MAEDTNQNTAENLMGEGGFASPFEQLSINLDNYFNSDDFREGIQPGNLNPFSQAPSEEVSSGGEAPSGSGNPFGGNPFEFNPIGGEQSEEDGDNQSNPIMGDYGSYRNDSNSTDESLIISENPFGDIDTDTLFPAAEIDDLSESFSDSFEAGQARYESFREVFNSLETGTDTEGTDTEGDELAPFTSFLNTLSESEIELPSGSPIDNLDEFSDLASGFSELATSNAENFIEVFSEVEFSGISGNPFSEGNPFLSEDNPLTEILATEDSSAI